MRAGNMNRKAIISWRFRQEKNPRVVAVCCAEGAALVTVAIVTPQGDRGFGCRVIGDESSKGTFKTYHPHTLRPHHPHSPEFILPASPRISPGPAPSGRPHPERAVPPLHLHLARCLAAARRKSAGIRCSQESGCAGCRSSATLH